MPSSPDGRHKSGVVNIDKSCRNYELLFLNVDQPAVQQSDGPDSFSFSTVTARAPVILVVMQQKNLLVIRKMIEN